MKCGGKHISLYWDYSNIWGFLVYHSLQSASIPFKIISTKDILENGIESKLLIVPGGSARLKSLALGENGRNIIRNFVAEGGKYLGFCGGAGFALSTNEGLSLCPWKRSTISDRLLHHVSGHLAVTCETHSLFDINKSYEKKLPVWFPARFEADENIENAPFVLARYTQPSNDFFMSDLPLSLFSQDFIQESFDMYGTDLEPKLSHEPSTVLGKYKKGEYILSYAHLETPNSPFSNAFYFNILKEFACIGKPVSDTVPELLLDSVEIKWEDSILCDSRKKLENLFSLALDLQLFFRRTPWLYGWKNGLPGIQFANLRAAFVFIMQCTPNKKMLEEWNIIRQDFHDLFSLFYEGAYSWLYAQRLCQSLPDIVPSHLFVDQKERLFGKAMEINGICNALVRQLESIFIANTQNLHN